LSYKKITKPDLKPHLPSRCGIGGCPNGPDVMAVTRKGIQVTRCARHYMDDIDRYRGSATSDALLKHMTIEKEEQKIVGKKTYAKEAFERLRVQMGWKRKERRDEMIQDQGLD